MSLTPRYVALTLCTLGFGLALSAGCEPRKTAKTGGTAAATATTTAPATATTTAAPTATTTAAPTATPAPTGTATAPTATPTATAPPMAWPTAIPGLDPTVIAEAAKKAQEMGLPIPGGTGAPSAAGDPIDAGLKASAAKNAPGYTPVGSVGKATLKQGEHAGMNVNVQQGKCYVFIAVGGAGVTNLTLSLQTTPPLPTATLVSDSGPTPVLGAAGKQQLCPPTSSTVRADVVITAGAGQVGVQALVK